jgi:paraquat-inducible protein B
MEPKQQPDSLRETKPRLHKGFAFFWLVPVAAVGLTAYLFYQTINSEGTNIEITFQAAKGLVPGKSELHYHGVKVGIVKEVILSDDLRSVIVHAQLQRSSNNLAKAGSEFWIVHPQISLNGVSGLDTLISGNYIEVQTTGQGDPQTKFVGLDHADGRDQMSPDMYVRLYATNMPSVGIGSPVLFRQMPVGEVVALNYDVDHHHAHIDLHIYKEYIGLIRKQTRFWNTSGLDVTMGLSGVTVRSGSLDSVIFGSISLGLPDALYATSPLAPEGTEFQLFDSVDDVIEHEAETINDTDLGVGRVLTLKMEESQGITPQQTELRYRGIKIGTVVSVQFASGLDGVLVKILLVPKLKNMAPDLYPELQNIARQNSRFILVWPQIQLKGMTKLQVPPDVVSGPYIRVEPGDGPPCTEFSVTDIQDDTFRPMDGLNILLKAREVGKLAPGAPIYYRGVQVGQVEESGLASDGSAVQLHAVIGSEYAPLVRANSKFWNCSGITSTMSLMGGLQIKSESVTSILTGGVAFATPDNALMGPKARAGASFDLADKPDDAWLAWTPSIPLDQ